MASARSGNASDVAALLGQAVRSVDRGMPVFDVRRMKDFHEIRAVKTPRLLSTIAGTLG